MKLHIIRRALILINAVTLSIVILFAQPTFAATLNVPSQYSTIQAAINAASNHDIIVLASGVYSEMLSINKAITIKGAGTGSSIIHFETLSDAIVSINGSTLSTQDTIFFKDLTITGGTYLPPDIFYDVSTKGIEAIDANIRIDDVSFNFISNYVVTVEDGSLNSNDVQLFPDFLSYTFQCDVGYNIKNSSANINNLIQNRGNIDHTIDINSYTTAPDPLFADIIVKNCTIRASELSWGECVRTYGNCHLLITQCNFYRPAGGAAMQTLGHSGLGINGPYANVWVDNTTMNGIPWGIQIHGSFINSNRIVVGNCTIKNFEVGGIQVRNSNYSVLDLGRGNYGSPGSNQFMNNNQQDVRLENSTGDVFAGNNSWSNNADPDVAIYDKLDDVNLGKVIHNMTCQSSYSMANGNRLTHPIIGNGRYETDGIIESQQIIHPSGHMIYDSGSAILLLPNFHVRTGATFQALIDGCN